MTRSRTKVKIDVEGKHGYRNVENIYTVELNIQVNRGEMFLSRRIAVEIFFVRKGLAYSGCCRTISVRIKFMRI